MMTTNNKVIQRTTPIIHPTMIPTDEILSSLILCAPDRDAMILVMVDDIEIVGVVVVASLVDATEVVGATVVVSLVDATEAAEATVVASLMDTTETLEVTAANTSSNLI